MSIRTDGSSYCVTNSAIAESQIPLEVSRAVGDFRIREPNRSCLRFGQWSVYSYRSKPNAWYRFWQRFLCGIRWEDVAP